jgi:hypothetical protein
MKPKYTATDLFKLKKMITVLSIVDGMLPDYVDDCFNRMETKKISSRDIRLLFMHQYKHVTEHELPGMTERRMKEIAKEYKEKKRTRLYNAIEVMRLYLGNRLLPLTNGEYMSFGIRSRKHYQAVYRAKYQHSYREKEIEEEVDLHVTT